MYGEGFQSLARRMGLSERDAEEFAHGFAEAYPEIQAWQDRVWRTCISGRKVKTLFGRYRSFPVTGDSYDDSRMWRQAVNYPIQSLASDINLWMSWEVNRELQKSGLSKWAWINNVVHDSEWLEAHQDCWLEAFTLAKQVMEDRSRLPFDFGAPLRVAGVVGFDLGTMMDESYLVDHMGFKVDPRLVAV
jgi:DNA polymerase I-like protein with 3'-5' exonuclease and polymerase domains